MNLDAILIAGPTASGKTEISIDFAKKYGGSIINADSMQIYSILNVLTSRPSKRELEQAPHNLFGHVHPSQDYSVVSWLEDVTKILDTTRKEGRLPIFVGGTGLYFKALLEGIASVPEIEPRIRKKWREGSQFETSAELYKILVSMDPDYAALLKPSDRQRIVRGLEVFESSGKSLLYWQNIGKSDPILKGNIEKYIILPDRTALNERIRLRFEKMVESGAIEEVKTLLALGIVPNNTAMKAIGVSQIDEYLDGQCSIEEAIENASIATRQYAKRQSTWFRNQFAEGWQFVRDLDELKVQI